MSKKTTGKPSAAAAAKAAQQAEAQSTESAKKSEQASAKAVETMQGNTTPETSQGAGEAIKDVANQEALNSTNEQATDTESEVAQTSEFRNTYHESEAAQDPEPNDVPVPPVTVAAKAQSQSQPDPEPQDFEPVTVENCTHFQSKNGRVFPATEVLRRLARRQDLKPVNLAE
ncbi:MAG: hypothetical protein CMQ46_13975 [Gammaproteobacteria bacterium]|nr:hypothetical protein [Gammaproteobacteria bacterium]MBJ56359.1 hypothetical protein [Gammaproteobacteria bacterium]HBN13464.1 hypothetical protein [Pseudohongiella sp.]